jgi:hypothetical protein
MDEYEQRGKAPWKSNHFEQMASKGAGLFLPRGVRFPKKDDNGIRHNGYDADTKPAEEPPVLRTESHSTRSGRQSDVAREGYVTSRCQAYHLNSQTFWEA